MTNTTLNVPMVSKPSLRIWGGEMGGHMDSSTDPLEA
jgi:hypothetical protein